LEFWTCAEDLSIDRASILYLYTKNLLNGFPYDLLESELLVKNQNLQNKVDQFWTCFDTSIKINNRSVNSKQRILSIIANNFEQHKIREKLK
ncbi:33065_t:CDS:1, partial [Gigaspora margarita]